MLELFQCRFQLPPPSLLPLHGDFHVRPAPLFVAADHEPVSGIPEVLPCKFDRVRGESAPCGLFGAA